MKDGHIPQSQSGPGTTDRTDRTTSHHAEPLLTEVYVLARLHPEGCPAQFSAWKAHAALDELGCCCTPGAEGCDSQIDVGAQAGEQQDCLLLRCTVGA